MLDLKEIFGAEGLVEPLVSTVRFSPDGKRLTFLKGKVKSPKVLDLWEANLETGESNLLVDSESLTGGTEELSKEEKDRRERMRLFSSGIVSYQWSPCSSKILFPIAGRLYLWDSGNNKAIYLNSEPSNLMDPKFSNCGSFVLFVENQNVASINLETLEKKVLTTEGVNNIRCGEPEFVVQEELSRYEGYWLSPDSKVLAYEVYDESSVELVTRNEIFSDRVDIIEQRYPYAGKSNVSYQVNLVNLETGKVTATKLDTLDNYLARAKWSPDSSALYVQIINRRQDENRLIKVSQNGECEEVITEKTSPWINVNNVFRFSKDGSKFLWGSERSDLCQVYEYSSDGKLLRQLTNSEGPISDVLYWDETELIVSAITKDALSKEVLKVDLGTLESIKLISRDGYNEVSVSSDKKHLVSIFNEIHIPQEVSILSLENGKETNLHKARCFISGKEIDSVLKKPDYGVLKSTDGKVDLNYRIFQPHDFDPSKKYPAIVHLYGGPHAQMVTKAWAGDRYLFQQYLASKGFVVISIDNRGSANRGLTFEGAIYKNMGDLEVEDQLAAATYLRSLSYVDGDRIGVHGWSYGGYMTLMCMFKAGDVFKVGVSGAPVTDWKLYDTCYTERYMSTPQDNESGYTKASVFPYVDGLKGKLMVIHGMADDNVLFTNSTMLYSALHKADKLFDIMVYPGEKHSVAGTVAKIHNYKTISEYFVNHL